MPAAPFPRNCRACDCRMRRDCCVRPTWVKDQLGKVRVNQTSVQFQIQRSHILFIYFIIVASINKCYISLLNLKQKSMRKEGRIKVAGKASTKNSVERNVRAWKNSAKRISGLRMCTLTFEFIEGNSIEVMSRALKVYSAFPPVRLIETGLTSTILQLKDCTITIGWSTTNSMILVPQNTRSC